MTEAEKMAAILETVGDCPEASETCENAAALIRSQEAKIKRMAEALRDAYMAHDLGGRIWVSSRHADALRDAGVSE